MQAHRATRSAYLRDLAERDLTANDAARRERIRRLLANPEWHGGDTVAFIKRMRAER